MKRLLLRLVPAGLTARLIAIVVLVMALDFGSNAVFFRRASGFTLSTPDAAILAERLSHAAQTVDSAPVPARADLARRLSGNALRLDWQAQAFSPVSGLVLSGLHQQLLQHDPSLVKRQLQLQLSVLHPGEGLHGDLVLPDGSHMVFVATPRSAWPLMAGHVFDLVLPTATFAPLALMLVLASLRPLRDLVRASRRIGTPHFRPLEERGPAEVRLLVRAFNAMQRRIDSLFEDNTNTLLAIGHDLRTPLARLQLRLDSVGIAAEERHALDADIAEMRDLLASLQTFIEADSTAPAPERVDLAAMAQTLVDQAEDAGHRASYSGPDRLVVMTQAIALRRALGNVLDNALHYGGSARLHLAARPGAVDIVVEDDGPGIAPEDLDRVRQPFVRLDAARERNSRGMGLGLAIVERAVGMLGGELALANRAQGGLAVTITLPA